MPIIKTKVEKYDSNLKGVVICSNKEYSLDNLVKDEEVEIEIRITELILEVWRHLLFTHTFISRDTLHKLIHFIVGAQRDKLVDECLRHLDGAPLIYIHKQQDSLLIMPWQPVHLQFIDIIVHKEPEGFGILARECRTQRSLDIRTRHHR